MCYIRRYSQIPKSLPLRSEVETRTCAMSVNPMSQGPVSPQTPSPREVDAMLRNTFASTPSPLSQQCNTGDSKPQWSRLDSVSRSNTPAVLEGKRNRGDDAEKEDCYVTMQSSGV